MTRIYLAQAFCLCLFAGVLGCGLSTDSAEHAHDKGQNGGIIVSVGHDHYHVEAVFAEGGVMKLFTLGQDQSQVITVRSQELTAYLRAAGQAESVAVVLKPQPQPGDAPGTTSLFVGQLPERLRGSQLIVTVPNIQIDRSRYRFGFMTAGVEHDPPMPAKVSDAEARELYLTPGGAYRPEDIVANGSQIASEKYRGFRAAHDLNPQPGDVVCPITRTKGNPQCTWIVGGQTYQFCCPPCIDEFVKRAKEQPASIASPDRYVKE
jgi:hypothetical protein